MDAQKCSIRSKEAAMKDHLMIALIGIGLLIAAAPVLRGTETGPEAMIAHARSVVMEPHFSRDAMDKALVEVLDASLLILPKTDYAKEFRSLVEAARGTIGGGELFSDKAYQDLGSAYKLVNGGKAWQVPEELKAPNQKEKGIELATKICLKLLDSALAERKAGRNQEAVRDLLGFVLLVVTPMEA
jgi:hypothetical protein